MENNQSKANSFIPSSLRRYGLVAVALCLAACANTPIVRGYLPGDVLFYSAGSMQDAEYFAKSVKRAQSSYPFYSRRLWEDASAAPAPAMRQLLREYYPLSVRWELNDGRQFIAENIDISGIMRDYLATHDLKMQWQAEGRKRVEGDFDPALVYEVREDEVLLKWLVRYNELSPEQRGKELPRIGNVQYLVATVKGAPATGIDFDK